MGNGFEDDPDDDGVLKHHASANFAGQWQSALMRKHLYMMTADVADTLQVPQVVKNARMFNINKYLLLDAGPGNNEWKEENSSYFSKI